MLHLARKLTGEADDAEDVVQESFVKITASVAAYKAGSNPCAWIYRIVRNTALNYLKKYGGITVSVVRPFPDSCAEDLWKSAGRAAIMT